MSWHLTRNCPFVSRGLRFKDLMWSSVLDVLAGCEGWREKRDIEEDRGERYIEREEYSEREKDSQKET